MCSCYRAVLNILTDEKNKTKRFSVCLYRVRLEVLLSIQWVTKGLWFLGAGGEDGQMPCLVLVLAERRLITN